MEPVKLQLDKLPSSSGSHLVVRLDGKLSLESVSTFLQIMRAEPTPYLILDMSGLGFLDSAGVGGAQP